MERGRAARSLVGLALGFWTLSLVQAQAGPTWDRGDASFVETLGEGPEGQDKDRPVWPLRARLSGPTARYDHDILGGIPHWTRLTVAATACGSCPRA